jgi:cardiolipin synthase
MIFFMSKVHKKPYTAPQMERIARQSMYLYLPNLLTYGRIAAVPALVGCFFLDGDFGNWLSLAIFVVAALTDVLDGYVARAWEQQTSLGRMLDPIADKLLVSAALMMLAAQQTIAGWSLWAGVIILSREILVSGLREFLGEVNVSVPVTNLAKWKTLMQMIAIGFLLAGSAGDKIFPWTTLTGLCLLWVSAILTLYTGWDYFRAGMKHVLEMGHDE